MSCCTYACTNGDNCPVRQTRISTACCHRHDCADTHCPGRPDRPPRTVALQCTNSDGSDPGHAGYSVSAHETAARVLDVDWVDEIRYWVVVALVSLASLCAASLVAGCLFVR